MHPRFVPCTCRRWTCARGVRSGSSEHRVIPASNDLGGAVQIYRGCRPTCARLRLLRFSRLYSRVCGLRKACRGAMRILFNDFRRQWLETRRDTLDAVETVGANGWYILGSEVQRFELELANAWGVDHAVGVAS